MDGGWVSGLGRKEGGFLFLKRSDYYQDYECAIIISYLLRGLNVQLSSGRRTLHTLYACSYRVKRIQGDMLLLMG